MDSKVTDEMIKQLVQDVVDLDIKMTSKQFVQLRNKGYTLVCGGDMKFEKLKAKNKDFDFRPFETETWGVYEKGKKLTDAQWKELNSQCGMRGDKEDLKKELGESELEEAAKAEMLKDISKEELHKIWDEKDVKIKKQKALELLSSLKFESPSVVKIKKTVEQTEDGTAIDKAITNLMFVGHGEKVIKIK